MLAVCCLIISFSMYSCKKDKLLFSATPEISISSVTPTTVTQFRDSIVVLVHYKDGDGDVGFTEPDSLSMVVQDDRTPNPDWYYVPPLAPAGSVIAIQGELEIKLHNTFLLGSGSQEITKFHIKLKDRAGHWSNEVTTPQITINR